MRVCVLVDVHIVVCAIVNLVCVRFDDLAQPIFSKVLEIVCECLEKAKLKKHQIDTILMVGGSSRIPKVREMLCSFFGKDPVHSKLSPDLAIAAGAAVWASLRKADTVQKIGFVDRTVFAVGIECQHNVFDVVLPHNSPLPFSGSHRFITCHDYQTSIDFKVMEGDWRARSSLHCEVLGDFSVHNLPREPAGVVAFKVTIAVDMQGIILVTAQVLPGWLYGVGRVGCGRVRHLAIII